MVKKPVFTSGVETLGGFDFRLDVCEVVVRRDQVELGRFDDDFVASLFVRDEQFGDILVIVATRSLTGTNVIGHAPLLGVEVDSENIVSPPRRGSSGVHGKRRFS